MVRMIRTTLFISAILISTTAISKPDVPIQQCAKWNKQVEEYKDLSRNSDYKEWYRKKQKEAKEKMMRYNCPPRHNEYFK